MTHHLGKTRKPGEGCRPLSDCYPTERPATRAFLATGELKRRSTLWEPTSGMRWMAEEIIQAGHSVVETDLFDYGYPQVLSCVDFLEETALLAPIIMTNFPYYRTGRTTMGAKCVRHAMKLGATKIIALFPTSFLGAADRISILPRKGQWADYGLARIYPFIEKFAMWPAGIPIINPNTGKPGNGAIQYTWFVWEQGFKGVTTIPTMLSFKEFEDKK